MTTIVRRAAAGSPALSRKLVVYWSERMLKVLSREEAELSVLLTNDAGIQRLNRDYRHKDRPTDVLSFHFDAAGLPASLEAEWLLGDIVISLDTAQRQADSRHRPLEEEVRWLLAHGILHLVGYDHATADEKRVMVAMTRKLVRAAGDAPSQRAATTTAKSKPRQRSSTATGARGAAVARPVSRKAPPSSPRRPKRAATSPRRSDKKPAGAPSRTRVGQKKTRER